MPLDISILPQQPPFVFVDEVLASDKKSAVTKFCVPHVHPLVEHDRLTVGGLLENMAQTSVFIVDDRSHFEMPKQAGMIAAILDMSVVRQPLKGECLTTSATVVEQAFGIRKVEASVSISGCLIASATIKVVVQQP